MRPHDSQRGVGICPEEQVPDFMGHHVAEDSGRTGIAVPVQSFHRGVEDIAVDAIPVLRQEGGAKNRITKVRGPGHDA